MMHFLVAKGLVNKIVLSRLVSGHSHCDPDGVFGVVWQVFVVLCKLMIFEAIF